MYVFVNVSYLTVIWKKIQYLIKVNRMRMLCYEYCKFPDESFRIDYSQFLPEERQGNTCGDGKSELVEITRIYFGWTTIFLR